LPTSQRNGPSYLAPQKKAGIRKKAKKKGKGKGGDEEEYKD
jgi:hypothetical protein